MGCLVKKYPNRMRLGLLIGMFALGSVLAAGIHESIFAATLPDDDLVVRRKAEVSIITDQQMDFGQVADNSGSVTLGLGDSITNDPDHIAYGGAPYSGIFTITGDPDTAVDISVSTNSSDGFTLSSFISSEGDIPLVGALLDSSGELVLTIGATLTLDDVLASIGSGQSISFTIVSTYN